MPDFTFKVTGTGDLYKRMTQLPGKIETNIMRGAIRAAAKPIVTEAQSRVPVLKDTDERRIAGALKKSIRAMGVQMKNGVLEGGVVAGGKLSVGRGKNKVAADAFYAVWVEFGHLIRSVGKAIRGGTKFKRSQREAAHASGAASVPPQPYMRPAVDTRTGEAIAVAAQYIAERVDKELQ